MMKNNKVELLTYQSKYCKELIELFYNTVHCVNLKDYTQEQLNVWATNEINIPNWDKSLLAHYSLVARIQDNLVGFGDIDKTGYLDRLYVHKNYQGMGIATTLINALEQEAKDNYISTIRTHSSITAKSFFTKHGYKVVKKQAVERKGHFLTNFVMIKHLL